MPTFGNIRSTKQGMKSVTFIKSQAPKSKFQESSKHQTSYNNGPVWAKAFKRQRTAALQNLADSVAREQPRQRLGVRLSSAALSEFDVINDSKKKEKATHGLAGIFSASSSAG